MTSKPEPSPVPRWYLSFLVFVALVALAGVGLAVNGIYTNNRQDAEAAAANKARDGQTADILQCFNRYTTDTNSTSKDQRPLVVAVTATQNIVAKAQLRDSFADRAVTLAARDRGEALDAVLQFAVGPNLGADPVTGQRLVTRLIQTQRTLIDAETAAVPIEERLSKAYRKYVNANTTLEEFRQQNPVPDPPSATCAVRDRDEPSKR